MCVLLLSKQQLARDLFGYWRWVIVVPHLHTAVQWSRDSHALELLFLLWSPLKHAPQVKRFTCLATRLFILSKQFIFWESFPCASYILSFLTQVYPVQVLLFAMFSLTRMKKKDSHSYISLLSVGGQWFKLFTFAWVNGHLLPNSRFHFFPLKIHFTQFGWVVTMVQLLNLSQLCSIWAVLLTTPHPGFMIVT